MNIIWVVIVILIFLLYAEYRWKIIKKLSSQLQPKTRLTPDKPTRSESSSRKPSVYSLSGQSLSAPKDEFKRSDSFQPSVAKSPKPPSYSPARTIFPNLEAQLRELATQAWTTEQSLRSQLLLNPKDFVNIAAPAQVVEVLIRHAERTTPGFSVPYMVPRVLVASMPTAAGMFKVDEEGWVTIELGENFFQDKLAAQAILAHEVCHYILENSGIRKSDANLNERYTDLCMFVCGFGEIFLAGYRRDAAQQDYRLGHRLGYLTDAEYQFAQRYVIQLRQSGEISPPKELDVLKRRLLALLYGDHESCSRNIELERRRSPHKSDVELYQDAINRLERDRGR